MNLSGLVRNIGGEGEGGRKGKGGRGKNMFCWSMIVWDGVTVAVVSTLSIVLLRRQCSASMVKHAARPVPT